MSLITDRILAELGDAKLMEKLSALPASDLNSLLLSVFQERSATVKPVDMLKSYQINRFCKPSEIDAAAYHALESELLSLAQQMNISSVLLSPSSPFASCSAFGCVDQNNVVSATRGIEVLSDPTNMLAVIIAERLRKTNPNNVEPMHLCTTARVIRAQVFPNTNRHFAHFGVFCIVSSGKDSGSYTCEKDLLARQLAYYRRLLIEKYGAKLSVVLCKRQGYADGDGFFHGIAKLVKTELPDVPLTLDLDHADNHYYRGIAFKMFMEKEGERIEIGDGGYVDWIQRMTNNKKERCLISGIGLDRFLL